MNPGKLEKLEWTEEMINDLKTYYAIDAEAE